MVVPDDQNVFGIPLLRAISEIEATCFHNRYGTVGVDDDRLVMSNSRMIIHQDLNPRFYKFRGDGAFLALLSFIKKNYDFEVAFERRPPRLGR